VKILVLGSNGLVGNGLRKLLNRKQNLDKYETFFSTRKDTNLYSEIETKKLISEIQPDTVINAAAKVGGIIANNTQRFDFITKNLRINLNIFESIKQNPSINVINLGSSCIYPLDAPNPIKESYIMSGKLEPTNSPYAMAKLSSIEMGNALNANFGNRVINLMPTNLYGPNDNFSENGSHVIPGLMRRMHIAKIEDSEDFKVWGTGNPLREFLHVDDLARAILHVLENDSDISLLNVGSNKEVSIKELSLIIKKVIGYEGSIIFDDSYPDGNPRKLLDSTLIFETGWKPEISLMDGLIDTYTWFLENEDL
jgi:GDP-L-fucose synthase